MSRMPEFELGASILYRRRFGAEANSKAASGKVFEHVVEVCGQGRAHELLDYDQLRMASRAGEAFPGFVEGPISHGPTFKVAPTV